MHGISLTQCRPGWNTQLARSGIVYNNSMNLQLRDWTKQTNMEMNCMKRALDRSSSHYQILVLKKKAGVDFHQFLVLSAISHSPLKLFKV